MRSAALWTALRKFELGVWMLPIGSKQAITLLNEEKGRAHTVSDANPFKLYLAPNQVRHHSGTSAFLQSLPDPQLRLAADPTCIRQDALKFAEAALRSEFSLWS